MDRALLILDTEIDRSFVAEAGKIVAGVDAELYIVQFVDEGNYQGRLERAATSGKEIESISEAEEIAKQEASEFAAEVLEGINVSYETDGIVGRLPQDAINYAEEMGCDHVFVSGKQRSPTGKAVFGDIAQFIVLNFDGPVTIRVS